MDKEIEIIISGEAIPARDVDVHRITHLKDSNYAYLIYFSVDESSCEVLDARMVLPVEIPATETNRHISGGLVVHRGATIGSGGCFRYHIIGTVSARDPGVQTIIV